MRGSNPMVARGERPLRREFQVSFDSCTNVRFEPGRRSDPSRCDYDTGATSTLIRTV